MNCKEKVKREGTPCNEKGCRLWQEYDKDLNCSLISIDKYGNMTLHEVAKRIGVSHVRIKQIQDKALKKLLLF